MRTVRDKSGVTWICLELPQVPAGTPRFDGLADDAVALECNSGAARAIVLVPADWEDSLDDATLVARIGQALTV